VSDFRRPYHEDKNWLHHTGDILLGLRFVALGQILFSGMVAMVAVIFLSVKQPVPFFLPGKTWLEAAQWVCVHLFGLTQWSYIIPALVFQGFMKNWGYCIGLFVGATGLLLLNYLIGFK